MADPVPCGPDPGYSRKYSCPLSFTATAVVHNTGHFPGVLVWNVITKGRGLGGLNSRYLLLAFLEAGRSKIKVQQCQFLVRTLFGLQMATFKLCSQVVETGRGKERVREKERGKEKGG